MEGTNIDKKTYEIIKDQLGREPDNVAGVAEYCPHDLPLVLLSYPYSKQKGIFPTIYWLSCPYYVKKVDHLEDEGLIEELTLKLDQDLIFKRKMKAAHSDYAHRRMCLLNKEDLKRIKKLSPDILKVLKESGVGGIKNKGGIKCLHTHLAHYLVDNNNPAGKIVYQKLPPLITCDCKKCNIIKKN